MLGQPPRERSTSLGKVHFDETQAKEHTGDIVIVLSPDRLHADAHLGFLQVRIGILEIPQKKFQIPKKKFQISKKKFQILKKKFQIPKTKIFSKNFLFIGTASIRGSTGFAGIFGRWSGGEDEHGGHG